jgi:hypothetical protein
LQRLSPPATNIPLGCRQGGNPCEICQRGNALTSPGGPFSFQIANSGRRRPVMRGPATGARTHRAGPAVTLRDFAWFLAGLVVDEAAILGWLLLTAGDQGRGMGGSSQ